jgi:uncharacterized protein YnzC (UPF0291/DUF896 family)
MEHQNPSDHELLTEMGLTEAELRDLHAKHHAYLNSLSPAQKKVLQRSMPKVSDAAATFHANVTPERLQQFMQKYSPSHASTLVFNEGHSGH